MMNQRIIGLDYGSKTVGVAVSEDVYKRQSQIFSTAADNQSAVDINVVQGERQFAKDNKRCV